MWLVGVLGFVLCHANITKRARTCCRRDRLECVRRLHRRRTRSAAARNSVSYPIQKVHTDVFVTIIYYLKAKQKDAPKNIQIVANFNRFRPIDLFSNGFLIYYILTFYYILTAYICIHQLIPKK